MYFSEVIIKGYSRLIKSFLNSFLTIHQNGPIIEYQSFHMETLVLRPDNGPGNCYSIFISFSFVDLITE